MERWSEGESDRGRGRQVGVGTFIAECGPNSVALHQAANEGFRGVYAVVFDGPDRGRGAVILSNGDNNAMLANARALQELLLLDGWGRWQGVSTQYLQEPPWESVAGSARLWLAAWACLLGQQLWVRFDAFGANSAKSGAISTNRERAWPIRNRLRLIVSELGQFWTDFDTFRANLAISCIISTDLGRSLLLLLANSGRRRPNL